MKNILLISLLCITFGCTTFLLKQAGVIDNEVEIRKIKMKEKDILFLPMVHLSEPKFYEECQKAIDSLVNKGYFIFGELVQTENRLQGKKPSVQDTINAKKARQLLGLDITDYKNNSTFSSFVTKYNLVNQPSKLYIDKDSSQRKLADLTASQLIKAYEKDRGEIILKDCDKKTPIGAKYECGNNNAAKRQYFMDNIVINKRNEYVAEQVRQSKYKKILLIYGEKHYKGMKYLLEEGKTTMPRKNKAVVVIVPR